MWLELTTSPSTSSSGTTRVSKRGSSRSSCASPWALWPKRKFSPTLTASPATRSTSTWSTKSCALRAAKSPSNGMTTSSSTPSVAISSALRSSVVSSFGWLPGATTDCGCGSNVTTVSAPAMTSRWPEVDAVERPDRHPPRPRLHVGQIRELHARKPMTIDPRAAVNRIRPGRGRSPPPGPRAEPRCACRPCWNGRSRASGG